MVEQCVWLYCLFSLSFRDIEEMMASECSAHVREGSGMMSEVWPSLRRSADKETS